MSKVNKKKWPSFRREKLFLSNGEAYIFLFFEVLYIAFAVAVAITALFLQFFPKYVFLNNLIAFILLWGVISCVGVVYFYKKVKKYSIKAIANNHASMKGIGGAISFLNWFVIVTIFWVYRCITIGRK